MKQTLFSMVCLLTVGILGTEAQVNIIALHHEGNVTICTQGVQNAIDQAVEGDTLYLSEGIFGGFTINKGLAIIGTGMTTIISSQVLTTGNISGLYIGNMKMMEDIEFTGEQDSIKLVQCRMESNCFFNSFSGCKYTNIEIHMCHIVNNLSLGMSGELNGLTVSNSKIKTLDGYSAYEGAANYTYCNIYGMENADAKNYFVNCNIMNVSDGTLQNCLYNVKNGEPVISDCWQDSSMQFDDDLICSLSDEQLLEAGYVGSDGYVVGINGGGTPFTLASPLLQVTEHKLDVDNANRRMTVTLKLGNK